MEPFLTDPLQIPAKTPADGGFISSHLYETDQHYEVYQQDYTSGSSSTHTGMVFETRPDVARPLAKSLVGDITKSSGIKDAVAIRGGKNDRIQKLVAESGEGCYAK